jgi:hypothetical protein
MRTTLTLADDVYEAVKTLAEGSGRSMGEIMSALARQALQPKGESEYRDGLPVFAVPPSSEIIPGSRAAELLADEGVE